VKRNQMHDLRDQVKSTVTMTEALDILGFEPPNRSGKIRSLQNPSERTPSLHVYDRDWYDYSTGEGGDVIDFAMKARGLSYHDALERLSGRRLDPLKIKKVRKYERQLENLNDTFVGQPQASPAGYRRAEEFVAKKWPYLQLDDLLGFDVRVTETELWTPHKDASGIVRGIKRRSTETGAKYSIAGSTFTCEPYRVRHLVATPLAVLVEGESDLWCMEMWLRKNGWQYKAFAYALPSGAATWRNEWKELFRKHQHTIICLDDDDAGRTATKKIAYELQDTTSVCPPGGRVAEAIETADQWLAPVMELAL
tara:strand:- start:3476 stop:4402 length:927 start_codon:yes stop_codon:yes gene_type:complete